MAFSPPITRYMIDPPVSVLWKHLAAGGSAGVSVTGWTGAAAASQGSNGTFFQLTGTFTTAGTPVVYAGLHNVPTVTGGFPTKIYGVDFAGAKTAGTAATNYLSTVGIYQVVPTAGSVNVTITTIVEETTDRLAGASSATPTDISIDFATPTEVGANGLLLIGFTFVVPDEATTYKLYHPSVRVSR